MNVSKIISDECVSVLKAEITVSKELSFHGVSVYYGSHSVEGNLIIIEGTGSESIVIYPFE